MIENVDSLAREANISSLYSDLLANQSAQFTILISVLCGLVVLIVGATWYWNYRGAKMAIKSEVERAKQPFNRLIQAYRNKNKEESEALIQSVLSKKEKEYQAQMKELKESVESENLKSKAELFRIFALHCTSTNSFLIGAQWWFGASEMYQKTNQPEWVGISIDSAISALEKCIEAESLSEEDKDTIDSISEGIDKIPEILSTEKRKAKSLFKKLKTKFDAEIAKAQ